MNNFIRSAPLFVVSVFVGVGVLTGLSRLALAHNLPFLNNNKLALADADTSCHINSADNVYFVSCGDFAQ